MLPLWLHFAAALVKVAPWVIMLGGYLDLASAPEDKEWERSQRPIVIVAPLILRRRSEAWVICGQRHRRGAHHRRRPTIADLSAQHHSGVGHLLQFNKFPQVAASFTDRRTQPCDTARPRPRSSYVPCTASPVFVKKIEYGIGALSHFAHLAFSVFIPTTGNRVTNDPRFNTPRHSRSRRL
jgi:hypothetical protein